MIQLINQIQWLHRMTMLHETIEAAIIGKQFQPVIVERFKDEN